MCGGPLELQRGSLQLATITRNLSNRKVYDTGAGGSDASSDIGTGGGSDDSKSWIGIYCKLRFA